METTPVKTKVKVALDIEKKGCKLDQPVVSTGFVVGAGDKLLEKIRITLDVGDCKEWLLDPEFQRCKTEYWDNQPGLAERFAKEAIPMKEGLQKISDYIDSVYQRFDIECWLSDNPAFDLGHLDHHLNGIREYPVRHSPSGVYTPVEDPTEQLQGADLNVLKSVCHEMEKFWSTRTMHMPDDDAEGIWWQSVVMQRIKMSR